MKANRMWLFSDVIEKNKRVFKIPVYQRNYDWKNIQCEKLFEDIINANKKNCQHFIGTVVYIDDINGGSGLNEVLLIDGQQRITTIYILLKALYDESKNISIRTKEEIEEVMFNRHCDETYKIKLKPVKSDNDQLILLIKDKIYDMDKNSNVYKNYINFKSMIKNELEKNIELNDILNGIKKLEVVEIILDKLQGDEPQKIFESINSTGLELSLSDLIRNYLLMDDEKQDLLYKEYWLEIEKNVGYNNLGDFVINFLNSQISKSVNSKNAYQLFKKYCEDNNLTHEDVLKSIKMTSKYYSAFISENKYYSEKITNYLKGFYLIKQTTVLPLLFKIFDDYENKHIDEEILCQVLEYLLTYLVRITACEINKNLSKFMKSMYERVIGNNYDNYYNKFVIFLNDLRANNRMPTNEEFEEALINKPLYKKPICKYVLSIIENSTNERIDVSNLTIEHILPQKENAAVWKNEMGEDYNFVYEHYLHTLGNLTITGHNSELGTKSFNEKKRIIESNSKANILNKEILSSNRWDKEAILNRAKVLSSKLINKFKYVDIHSDINKPNKLSFNINSNDNFSDTKPSKFLFLGEYTKVSSWTDFLTKFISIAYELNTELINELARKNHIILNPRKICITKDKRQLKKPIEIEGSGIFFESDLSADSIISFIKDILIRMDYSDEENFSFSLSVFDIDEENTWTSKIIPVAKLFYNLIEDLIKNSKITIEEIENLKTKEYTKSLFKATDYPAIANDRNDNMGNSTVKRYRKEPLNFMNSYIYISTQFFDSDREAIISWYKNHLK